MSSDDSDEYHVYTRRETLQGVGTGVAATAYPMSHASGDDDGRFWSGWFSRDPDLVVTDADGNVITEDPDELRVDGSAVTGIEEIGHPEDSIVRITVDGGEGFWTETADGAVTPVDDQPVHVDAAHINGHQLFIQPSEPSSPASGDVWIDNDSTFEVVEVGTAKETFVRATRGTSETSVAAATFVNMFDGVAKDNNAEFNQSGNHHFSPEKTGEYEIAVVADIRGSTVQGDKIGVRIRNVTDSTTLVPQLQKAAPDSTSILDFEFHVALDSSKTYEIRVTNFDSSFNLSSANTVGVITWSAIQ